MKQNRGYTFHDCKRNQRFELQNTFSKLKKNGLRIRAFVTRKLATRHLRRVQGCDTHHFCLDTGANEDFPFPIIETASVIAWIRRGNKSIASISSEQQQSGGDKFGYCFASIRRVRSGSVKKPMARAISMDFQEYPVTVHIQRD